MGITVNLKGVQVIYLKAFERSEPRKFDDGSESQGVYEGTIILPYDHPQFNQLEKAALQELTEKMGSETAAQKWLDRNFGKGNHSDKCCVKDLAERDKPIEGVQEDALYIRTKSQKMPLILTSKGEQQTKRGFTIGEDEDGEEIQVKIEGNEVYSGCISNVSIDLHFIEKFKVLTSNFRGIRFKEEGKQFGGGTPKASKDDLMDDDDDKPSKPKRRPSRDEDDEEEERPRKKRRNYEDDEE